MTPEYKENITAFLKAKKIAIAGYSSDDKQPANHIYRRFAQNGYDVCAVNPKTDIIKDVSCYASIGDIPEQPDAVVICTHPNVTLAVIKECIKSNVKHVWMHRSLDQGSYNKEAADLAQKNNINCINAGCPLMFLSPDIAHKCIRWFMDVTGKLKHEEMKSDRVTR